MDCFNGSHRPVLRGSLFLLHWALCYEQCSTGTTRHSRHRSDRSRKPSSWRGSNIAIRGLKRYNHACIVCRVVGIGSSLFALVKREIGRLQVSGLYLYIHYTTLYIHYTTLVQLNTSRPNTAAALPNKSLACAFFLGAFWISQNARA